MAKRSRRSPSPSRARSAKRPRRSPTARSARSRSPTTKPRRPTRSTPRAPRRPARVAAATPKPAAPQRAWKTPIGTVTHYFTDISVCVVALAQTLKLGDRISIEGPSTAVRQKVESMQIDHLPVREARSGTLVGLKVSGRVREGDRVFRT